MQSTWTAIIQSSHGLCIVSSPTPPSSTFLHTSSPPHPHQSRISRHQHEATSGYSSRSKLLPPRLKTIRLLSSISQIPQKPNTRFEKDLHSFRARCCLQWPTIHPLCDSIPAAWTLAKSNRPILGTPISPSAPSTFTAFCCWQMPFSLWNYQKDLFATLSGARCSAPEVLALIPLLHDSTQRYILLFPNYFVDIHRRPLLPVSIITTPILVLSLIPLMLTFLIHALLRSQNQHRSARLLWTHIVIVITWVSENQEEFSWCPWVSGGGLYIAFVFQVL